MLLLLLLAHSSVGEASETEGFSGSGWKAAVSIGDVMSLAGWDGTEVLVRGGAAGGVVTREFDGTSSFANGAYLSGYAVLDRHFLVGGFVSYVGFGQSAVRSEEEDAFYRSLGVVGLGVSAKGGGRVHRVVWLGAALDVGLGIVLPSNVALALGGPRLELDPWYGMVLFPRFHVDIVASDHADIGIGFFWDLGPMFVPVARGSGSSRTGGTELEFSTWSVSVQMVLGFTMGG